jgi:hypothetical protein
MQADQYTVVANDEKSQLDTVLKQTGKEVVLAVVAEQFGQNLTEHDINVITKRNFAEICLPKSLIF